MINTWRYGVSRRIVIVGAVAMLAACAARTESDDVARRSELDAEADAALAQLFAENPAARTLGEQASGMLIFPSIVQAGLGVGGQTGDGVLRVGGETVDYYNTSAVSLGLQAGGQSFSQVIMFLDDESLEAFRTSDGWEAGLDGAVAVVGAGASGEIDTTNIQEPIVAFNFGEQGLMAAANIEGSKYTKKDL